MIPEPVLVFPDSHLEVPNVPAKTALSTQGSWKQGDCGREVSDLTWPEFWKTRLKDAGSLVSRLERLKKRWHLTDLLTVY